MSPKSGIVVTTTFKLSILVKELLEAQDTSLSDKKIVFIIDEAHRTTMGDMMGQIKDYFFKNSLFFGFTGTPLFDENRSKGRLMNVVRSLIQPKNCSVHSCTNIQLMKLLQMGMS